MMRTAHRALLAGVVTFVSCKGESPPSRIDRRVDVHVDAGSGDGHVDGGDAAAEQCLGSAGAPTASKPCGCEADCEPGETCILELAFGWAGGFCARSCRDDDECPEGLLCAFANPDQPGTGSCAQACTLTSDCRAGYVCQRNVSDPFEPGPLMCLPLCQDDLDCVAAGSCDRYATACGDVVEHPGDGEIGDPCQSDDDCRSRWCMVSDRFPGGYCTTGCSYSRQGCPPEASCMLQGPSDQDWGGCFRSCSRRSDCREDEGYVCAQDPNMPDYPVCAHP